MAEELMLDFDSPCGRYRLTFEDDGKVAYAYLKDAVGVIVGDLWLYNRCPTPLEPEWDVRSRAPFANSAAFVDEAAQLARIIHQGDVLVSWEYEEVGPVAYVYLFEDLYGVLGVGDKPGFARHARRRNRLARLMDIDEEPETRAERKRAGALEALR